MADKKQKILIVDDSEMNRDILAVMLGSDYEILEAENGLEAIEILQQGMTDIDLILLDIMMPEMDGFDVLGFMKRSHMTEVIPVIMISSESSSSYIEKAYEMGAADYISRPFNALIVGRRVINTLMLYAKQKRLVQMVADQVYEREKNNDMMVNILSHIVEFLYRKDRRRRSFELKMPAGRRATQIDDLGIKKDKNLPYQILHQDRHHLENNPYPAGLPRSYGECPWK